MKGLNGYQLVQGHHHGIPRLCFTDLRQANFTDCNVTYVSASYCDMSYAVLTRVTNVSEKLNDGFDLKHCIAKNIRFNRSVLQNVVWLDSDLNGARFNQSKIGPGRFSVCNFSDTVFDQSVFVLQNYHPSENSNFTRANFTTTRVSRSHYSKNNFTQAKFIKPGDAENLVKELNRIEGEFLEEFNQYGELAFELPAFKALIAADVERYIQALQVSAEDKFKLLQKSMQHPFFHYEYVEPVKALIVGSFPRPERTLVFLEKYDDLKGADKLDIKLLPTYQMFYAYGMKLLKQFADAARTPQHWICIYRK